MKKLPKYLTFAFALAMIWGAFSVSYFFRLSQSLGLMIVRSFFRYQIRALLASVVLFIIIFVPTGAKAASVFEQLSDQSTYIVIEGSGENHLVGVITNQTAFGEIAGSFLLAAISNIDTPSNVVGVQISTTSSSSTVSANRIADCNLSQNLTSELNKYQVVSATCTQSAATTNWELGETYYIWAASTPEARMLASYDGFLMWGYLTDSAGPTETILIPGIGGFTDFGISTSSQATYCNENIASSTGVFDGIGRAFTLGICQVGVFLFVPSSNAIAQFQSLSTTTRSKIPFSYYYDVSDILTGSVASSTANMPSFNADLQSLGIGSTTAIGNILPDVNYLSSSTITQYLPAGMYDLMFLLMRSAIWILVMFHIYRRLRPHHAMQT